MYIARGVYCTLCTSKRHLQRFIYSQEPLLSLYRNCWGWGGEETISGRDAERDGGTDAHARAHSLPLLILLLYALVTGRSFSVYVCSLQRSDEAIAKAGIMVVFVCVGSSLPWEKHELARTSMYKQPVSSIIIPQTSVRISSLSIFPECVVRLSNSSFF